MQTALCTLDHSQLDPWQFANLPPWIAAQRRDHLVCPGCDRPAYFRSGSRNGRAPCFCGHHAPGCVFAATAYAMQNPEPPRDPDPWGAPQRIAVDFAYGAARPCAGVGSGEWENPPDERRGSGGKGVHSNAVLNRRLRPILRSLLTTPFSQSNQPLQVTGHGDTTPAQFFVRFDTLSDRHVGQYHGYWGWLRCAKFGERGDLWLNPMGPWGLGICVQQHLVSDLLMRFPFLDPDKHTGQGVSVLVFGVLRIAPNDKPYIVVSDLAKVAMHDPSAAERW